MHMLWNRRSWRGPSYSQYPQTSCSGTTIPCATLDTRFGHVAPIALVWWRNCLRSRSWGAGSQLSRQISTSCYRIDSSVTLVCFRDLLMRQIYGVCNNTTRNVQVINRPSRRRSPGQTSDGRRTLGYNIRKIWRTRRVWWWNGAGMGAGPCTLSTPPYNATAEVVTSGMPASCAPMDCQTPRSSHKFRGLHTLYHQKTVDLRQKVTWGSKWSTRPTALFAIGSSSYTSCWTSYCWYSACQ